MSRMTQAFFKPLCVVCLTFLAICLQKFRMSLAEELLADLEDGDDSELYDVGAVGEEKMDVDADPGKGTYWIQSLQFLLMPTY